MAAHRVLVEAGRALEIDEILQEIVDRHLYQFNTPDVRAVLREQVRRHCANLDRELVYSPFLFRMTKDGKFEVNMSGNAPVRKSQSRRIQRATDKEDVIKFLTQAPSGPFKEIWRLMLFAAIVGFREKRREKLRAVDTGKGIDHNSFANSAAWPGVLYLLCLVETDQPEALSGTPEQDDARIEMFEEYANGGLSIIKERLEASSYSLDALMLFVAAQASEQESENGGLSEVLI
jgi:dnd system-associated protein 4